MSTPEMQIRPVKTDADLAMVVAIDNLWDRFEPTTVEEVQESDQIRPADAFHERYLLFVQGEPIGNLEVERAYWSSTIGQLSLGIAVVDHEWAKEGYRELLSRGEHVAQQNGATRLMLWARSNREQFLAIIEEAGFRVVQTNPQLSCDLTKFEAEEHLATEALDAAVLLMSYEELSKADPENWEYRLWQLEVLLNKDVPFPDESRDEPFDQWRKWNQMDEEDWPLQYVAEVNGELVGLSELSVNSVDPSLAATGLTGVLKEHRRKGIAKALKVRSMLAAKRAGGTRLGTDTEENNPMGLLNKSLGFVREYDWLVMQKSLV